MGGNHNSGRRPQGVGLSKRWLKLSFRIDPRIEAYLVEEAFQKGYRRHPDVERLHPKMYYWERQHAIRYLMEFEMKVIVEARKVFNKKMDEIERMQRSEELKEARKRKRTKSHEQKKS